MAQPLQRRLDFFAISPLIAAPASPPRQYIRSPETVTQSPDIRYVLKDMSASRCALDGAAFCSLWIFLTFFLLASFPPVQHFPMYLIPKRRIQSPEGISISHKAHNIEILFFQAYTIIQTIPGQQNRSSKLRFRLR
jgi:hypothetical protein